VGVGGGGTGRDLQPKLQAAMAIDSKPADTTRLNPVLPAPIDSTFKPLSFYCRMRRQDGPH
jgi:hypothetical protein